MRHCHCPVPGKFHRCCNLLRPKSALQKDGLPVMSCELKDPFAWLCFKGLIQAAVAHLRTRRAPTRLARLQGLKACACFGFRRSSSSYSPRDLAKFLNRLQGCGVLHHDMAASFGQSEVLATFLEASFISAQAKSSKAMAAEILQSSERRLRHRGGRVG